MQTPSEAEWQAVFPGLTVLAGCGQIRSTVKQNRRTVFPRLTGITASLSLVPRAFQACPTDTERSKCLLYESKDQERGTRHIQNQEEGTWHFRGGAESGYQGHLEKISIKTCSPHSTVVGPRPGYDPGSRLGLGPWI